MLNVWDRWLRLPFKAGNMWAENVCNCTVYYTVQCQYCLSNLFMCALGGSTPVKCIQAYAYARKKWLSGRYGQRGYHTQCGSQRLYGSVCNLSVCAKQCVMPAAFYVFNVCNGCSYVLLWLVWITVFFTMFVFTHFLSEKKENVWIYFSRMMSSVLNLSGKCNMSDYSKRTIYWTFNYKLQPENNDFTKIWK